jgi:hypothetical protein
VLWWTAAASSAATAGFKTASERPHPTFRSFLAAGRWWEPGEQMGPSFKKKHKDTVDIGVARSFLSSTTLSACLCLLSESCFVVLCLCASRQRSDPLALTCSAQNLDWSQRSGLLPKTRHFTLCFTLQLPIWYSVSSCVQTLSPLGPQ